MRTMLLLDSNSLHVLDKCTVNCKLFFFVNYYNHKCYRIKLAAVIIVPICEHHHPSYTTKSP